MNTWLPIRRAEGTPRQLCIRRAGHGSIPDRKTVMLDDVVIHDRIRSLAQQLGNAV